VNGNASGIAAVMALSVSRRRREIGVRMALGARSGSNVGMVLRQGLGLALAGTVLGITGAAGLTRLLATFLYGTSPTDPLTFVGVTALFLLVARRPVMCWRGRSLRSIRSARCGRIEPGARAGVPRPSDHERILNSPAADGARMSYSFDGRMLYFMSTRSGGNSDIYVATRERLHGK
jgi:ABC-type antimicrobial peptide transport system permease subunit